MVLAHLVRNAQDASGRDGHVTVGMLCSENTVTITVDDDGSGMSKDFIRDRLFRPFDSTKGAQGMGIGAYQAREFARKLRGDLKVESSSEQGTRMTMSIPVE